MNSKFRVLTISFCFALCIAGVAAQDLGSSNKLFGGRKKIESAPAKKTPVKRSAPAPKRRVPTAKTPVKTKTVEKPAAAAKTKVVPGKIKTAPVTTAKAVRSASRQQVTAKTKKDDKQASTPVKEKTAETVKKVEPTSDRPRFTRHEDPAAAELFEDLIEDGNLARDQRNYAAAEAAYRRAASLRSTDSRAAYGLGNLFSDQQRWEDAEKAYRTALELDSSSAIAHVALSYVLSQPIAAPNLSERYAEAEKLAREAIKLAPRNALAYDQLGVALELRGLIDSETENAYRRAIQLDPRFAPSYAHLGRLLRRRGMVRESAAAYQSAVERSTDVATMIIVTDVMQSELRFAESEELLRNALDDDPRNPAALILLGRALTTQGEFTEAESVLNRSLAVSPNAFLANSLLGTMYLRQGKLEQAEAALLRALRYVSSYEKIGLAQQFEAVGDAYMKATQRRLAEHVYRQAISLDSDKESLAGKLSRAREG